MPIAEILDVVWTAKPQTVLFEAANPRHAHEWPLVAELGVPDDKVICPGVIEPQSNYIEHPELGRPAAASDGRPWSTRAG